MAPLLGSKGYNYPTLKEIAIYGTEEERFCIGLRTQTERCATPLHQNDTKRPCDLAQTLIQSDLSSAAKSSELEKLGRMLLCAKYHETQSKILTRLWSLESSAKETCSERDGLDQASVAHDLEDSTTQAVAESPDSPLNPWMRVNHRGLSSKPAITREGIDKLTPTKSKERGRDDLRQPPMAREEASSHQFSNTSSEAIKKNAFCPRPRLMAVAKSKLHRREKVFTHGESVRKDKADQPSPLSSDESSPDRSKLEISSPAETETPDTQYSSSPPSIGSLDGLKAAPACFGAKDGGLVGFPFAFDGRSRRTASHEKAAAKESPRDPVIQDQPKDTISRVRPQPLSDVLSEQPSTALPSGVDLGKDLQTLDTPSEQTERAASPIKNVESEADHTIDVERSSVNQTEYSKPVTVTQPRSQDEHVEEFNFIPYKYNSLGIEHWKTKELGGKDRKVGITYVLILKKHPGIVKIGWSETSGESRMRALRGCLESLEEYQLQARELYLHAKRVESLVHTELHDRRLVLKCWKKRCCKKTCPFTEHNEFFRIEPAEAEKIITKWRNYVTGGEFKPRPPRKSVEPTPESLLASLESAHSEVRSSRPNTRPYIESRAESSPLPLGLNDSKLSALLEASLTISNIVEGISSASPSTRPILSRRSLEEPPSIIQPDDDGESAMSLSVQGQPSALSQQVPDPTFCKAPDKSPLISDSEYVAHIFLLLICITVFVEFRVTLDTMIAAFTGLAYHKMKNHWPCLPHYSPLHYVCPFAKIDDLGPATDEVLVADG